MKNIVRNLFLPDTFDNLPRKPRIKITAIIPSFKPGNLTIRLVRDLLRWNPYIKVYVVDDCTPIEYEMQYRVFEKISSLSKRVTVLRTPENKMKAAAINFALVNIFRKDLRSRPDVILTLDDDVIISKNTISKLIINLFEDERLGAVCSQCRVINKNKNLLTRLQGLEYLGFNGTRLADEGFFRGPLVMHGMLSAFRVKALVSTGFFAERHLIEDYEITSRMKNHGWHVRLAPFSYAWTSVPEKFSQLWKQRTRWTVGGLFVISKLNNWRSVIQDLIGHTLFITTLLLILISFIFLNHPRDIDPIIPIIIIELSIIQFLIWYLFQIWFMQFYHEKDFKDWIIRLLIIPEFIYANVLTLVLIGSYLFFISHSFFSWLVKKDKKYIFISNKVEKFFKFFGYSVGWGTRKN